MKQGLAGFTIASSMWAAGLTLAAPGDVRYRVQSTDPLPVAAMHWIQDQAASRGHWEGRARRLQRICFEADYTRVDGVLSRDANGDPVVRRASLELSGEMEKSAADTVTECQGRVCELTEVVQ